MKKQLFRISIMLALVFMLTWTSLTVASASDMLASKTLNVPYIDQVYVQNKIQSKDSSWKDPIWYLCGPSSLDMALTSFGLANTDVATTKTIAQNILVNPKTSAGRYTSWTKIPTYLQSQFKIKSQFKGTKLTFAEIKQSINLGHPILTGVSFTLPPNAKGNAVLVGHIVTIVGYAEPDIVIINDPFGGKIVPKVVKNVTYYNWSSRNSPPASSPKINGKHVKYKYTELAKILSKKWLLFISIPKKATPTRTATLVLPVTYTATPTQTVTPSITSTKTSTLPPVITNTATVTATLTPTATNTRTSTPTITFTPTKTLTKTITPTPTVTLTNTPTETATITPTPVVVTTTLACNQATYAQKGFPTTPTGSSQRNLYIGYETVYGKKETRIYLQCNLPALGNITILSAKIQLGQYVVRASSSYGVTAFRVTSSWSESTLTWNVQPAKAEAVGSATISTSTGTKEIDITNIARQWYSGVYPNYGVAIWANNEGSPGGIFCSLAGTASQCLNQINPKLRLQYQIP